MKTPIKSILTVGLLFAIFLGNISGGMFGNLMTVSAAQTPQKSGITILLDGKAVVFEQEPQLINGSVMAPAKPIAEAMGWEFRENTSTVFLFIKAALYTDGSKKYLFSSHTVTFNFDRELINKSIMVGVGRFFDTEKDHNIPIKIKPVIVNGVTFISVRELAKSLYATVEWDGPNKTVIITSGEIPYYDGQGLPNRDELFEIMRKYYKVSGTLVKVGEQPQPTETVNPKTTAPFEPTGVMTSAPEVGSVPAKILLPDKTDIKSRDSYCEPYKNNISSGCNWYSFGRLYETTGIWVPNKYQFGTRGGLVDVEAANLDYIKVERDINKIVSGCVGIFVAKTSKDTGHAVFVEYVERDSDEKPKYIYYTDSNYSHTGYYNPKTDAKVKKVTFEKFTKLYQTKVFDGYIIPVQ